MRTLSYYLALVLLLGGVASCQRETDPAPEEDVDLYTKPSFHRPVWPFT